jgi:steroid 5-alpha reductase family enzyme
MSFWVLLGLGAAGCVLIMLILWWLGIRQRNFSYVDIGWTANFAVLAVVYGLLGSGDPLRRAMICLMYGIWSVRLAIHLMRRIVGEPEEGRYVKLREDWGSRGNLNLKFLAFFEFQALLNVVLSVPMLLAVTNPAPVRHPLEVLGMLLWAAALLGESIADAQLSQFKRQPLSRGQVCRVGLWGVSRHPNYFFEWLIWVAYALFALGSPHGWIALAMPALMLHFLLNVTGIRATEEQALSSKGEAYRRYQQSVSAFIPWFPKKLANGGSSDGAARK